jgi:hypothetical protein
MAPTDNPAMKSHCEEGNDDDDDDDDDDDVQTRRGFSILDHGMPACRHVHIYRIKELVATL